jgi:hypothetical protein
MHVLMQKKHSYFALPLRMALGPSSLCQVQEVPATATTSFRNFQVGKPKFELRVWQRCVA